ncbi:MAG: leucine-rich repeat protein [Clostridia bacterium]|nr:leucine-rich repeat protein [Clostridia bacterium]
MERKKIKRFLNLIVLSFIIVSVGICGCKPVPLSASLDEPEIREGLTLPESPAAEKIPPEVSAPEEQAPAVTLPEILTPPIALPEEEVKAPLISAPQTATPPASSQTAAGTATQAEVPAEFEFTTINETECSVTCTNNDTATYAEIPEKAIIDGKEYTVTEIARGAFRYEQEGGVVGGSRLKTVTLSSTVKKIDNGAFQFCMQLTEVQGLSYVEELGVAAFSCCSGLTYADLSSALTIGDQAFIDCENLARVSLYKVTSIGSGVFGSCPKLSEIVIPQSVETMGYYVFIYSNTQVKIAKGTNTEKWDKDWNEHNENQNVIEDYAVPAEYEFTPVNDTECNVRCKNVLTAVTAVIPEMAIIDGKEYTVTEIRNSGFAYSKNLERVSLPSSVAVIGPGSFGYCSSLYKVSFSGVKEISNRAFCNCENLSEIDLSCVEVLDDYCVFEYCKSLTSVNISSVVKIGEGAFHGCENLESVEMSVVEEISEGAFSSCPKLRDIVIPESVAVMGSNVFTYDNTQIKAVAQSKPEGWDLNWNGDKDNPRIRINANQNVIWGWFEGKAVLEYTPIEGTENCSVSCTNVTYKYDVTYAEIPQTAIIDGKEYTVTEIAERAFYSFNNLQTVILPDSVTKIGNYAFAMCRQLNTISLAKVRAIGERAFLYCTELPDVDLSQVETIGGIAFALCRSLTSVNLSSATEIGELAFFGCLLLENIEIPKAASIGERTFASCSALMEIVIPITVESMGGRVFDRCTAQLYVVAEEKPEGWADNWNGSDTNIIWGWKDQIGRFVYTVISDTECAVSLKNKITAEEAYIPAKVTIEGKEYTVTQIADGGFANSTLLKKVVLPNTIQKIGGGAFANCPWLEEIVIPKSVEVVGKGILSGNETAVYARGSSSDGWSADWNAGNRGEVQFNSKYILPVEFPKI